MRAMRRGPVTGLGMGFVGGVLTVLAAVLAMEMGLNWLVMAQPKLPGEIDAFQIRDFSAFEADIRSRLPTGSTPEYIDEQLVAAGFRGETVHETGRTICRLTPRVRVNFLYLESRQVTLHRDEQRRLVAVEVRRFIIGP